MIRLLLLAALLPSCMSPETLDLLGGGDGDPSSFYEYTCSREFSCDDEPLVTDDSVDACLERTGGDQPSFWRANDEFLRDQLDECAALLPGCAAPRCYVRCEQNWPARSCDE